MDSISLYSYFYDPDLEKIINIEQKGVETLFLYIKTMFLDYGDSKDFSLIEKAYEFGKKSHEGQKRETGVDYFTHPLIATLLMMPYKPDKELIIATMLHDAIEDSENKETSRLIKETFGTVIHRLIDGVSKINSGVLSKKEASILTLQKLFEFAAEDSRTLLIKIFDRLHNLITIGGKNSLEKRKKKIKETMSVFFPATERLGLWQVKKIFKNASLYAINRKKYNEILKKTNQYLDFFEMIVRTLQMQDLSVSKIRYKKYSIERFVNADMETIPKNKLVYIQCIVPEGKSYEVFSQLNRLYPHKASDLKDYISNPKTNGYQALHATYIIHNAYQIRIQILTQEMHDKNNKHIFAQVHNKEYGLSFLSHLAVGDLKEDAEKFLNYLTNDFLSKEWDIHNPEHGAFRIPYTSTVLDAAVFLYPQRFMYIKEFYINKEEVESSELLTDHDIVEFVFSKEKKITYTWAKYVKTPLAKDLIDQEIELFSSDVYMATGRSLLKEACNYFKLKDFEKILAENTLLYSALGIKNQNELFENIAKGKISEYDIALFLRNHTKKRWFSFLQRWIPWTISKDPFHFSCVLKTSYQDFSNISALLDRYSEEYNFEIVTVRYVMKSFGVMVRFQATIFENKKYHFFNKISKEKKINDVKIS